MRNYLKTFSVILALSLSIAGCKKDDEKSNSLRAGDERFKLAAGILSNYYFAPWVEGCYYGLTLVSPEITVGEFGALSGSGKIIRFYIVSTSLIGLPSGEYEFDEDTYPYNSFGDASYCLDWEDGVISTYIDIVSGVLQIKNNNNSIYEITIDCVDENGDDVTGYFKGSLLLTSGMLVI